MARLIFSIWPLLLAASLLIGGGMLMLHGASAVTGPIIATTFVIVAVFVPIRLGQRLQPDTKADYVPVSRTASTGAAALDPRVDPNAALGDNAQDR